jgi:hypothetical protein
MLDFIVIVVENENMARDYKCVVDKKSYEEGKVSGSFLEKSTHGDVRTWYQCWKKYPTKYEIRKLRTMMILRKSRIRFIEEI